MGITAWKTASGELVFENGMITEITGEEALRQRTENRIRLWRGEWFLDEDAGIDWIDLMEAKPEALEETRTAIRQELLKDPAVTRIIELELSYDRATRKTTVTFQVAGNLGLVRGAIAI